MSASDTGGPQTSGDYITFITSITGRLVKDFGH